MTANGLSQQALRDLGVLHSGFTPNAEHYTELRALLNQMLESWSLEGLMVFSVARAAHALTSGQADYTMGPSGADITADRPTKIERAGFIAGSGIDEVPLDLLSLAEWQIQKPGVYVNMDSPDIDLKLRPAPAANQSLVLYTWAQLTEFADGTTDYTFPPGYELAMRKGLAVEAIPMMRIYFKTEPLLDRLERDAMKAKAAIKRANFKPAMLRCDDALVGGLCGTWRDLP